MLLIRRRATRSRRSMTSPATSTPSATRVAISASDATGPRSAPRPIAGDGTSGGTAHPFAIASATTGMPSEGANVTVRRTVRAV
jgi:hypothetical protein